MRYRLSINGHKNASINQEMVKKPIFKISGIFPENAVILNPSKASNFAKFKMFDVFLIC